MNNNEKFQTYKIIKDEIKFNYKGYPIEKIIALELLVRVYIKNRYSFKTLISFILKNTLPLFFSKLDLSELKVDEPSKTLFSMGNFHRNDYNEIWNFAQSHVKRKIVIDFSALKTQKQFDLKNIITAWRMINKTRKVNLLDKYWLAAKITFYLNVIDDLEEINPVVGKYCAFSSVQENEALLTLFFKKKGIPTYSLQHGLYLIYKKDIPLDAILYENLISDYLLCWGKFTKDEFVSYGIPEEKLLVAGYARKVKRPPLPTSLDKQECLVLLARYSYHESNLRLFEILEKMSDEHNINFHLKLHPSLYWAQFFNQYKEVASRNDWTIISEDTTVTGLLEGNKYGWAVSVNTSSYYEAYIKQVPCLRYNDGSFENMVDITVDCFSNPEEMNARYDSIPFDDSAALKKYFFNVDKNLNYAIGINKNEYLCLNV